MRDGVEGKIVVHGVESARDGVEQEKLFFFKKHPRQRTLKFSKKLHQGIAEKMLSQIFREALRYRFQYLLIPGTL